MKKLIDGVLICSVFYLEMKTELRNSNVQVKEGTWISKIIGDGDIVQGYEDETGNTVNTDGIFIELGAKSAIELFIDLGIELDKKEMKYIITDQNQHTNIAGIFAAGDICGLPLQVAKAIGQGCIAGISAADYVKRVE